MAIQSENEQDQAEETLDVMDTPSLDNGDEGSKEKRRGRAARRRRREEVMTAQHSVITPAEDDVPEVAPPRKDAPTPGRRQKGREGNAITRALRPVTTYLQETVVELRKVTWPTREETLRLSGIVLGVTFASALVLGLYNYLLSIGLDLLLRLVP